MYDITTNANFASITNTKNKLLKVPINGGKDWAVKKTVNNFVLIMQTDDNISGILRKNLITGNLENSKTGLPWEDGDDANLIRYIELFYEIRDKECYRNAFSIIAEKNEYNPIREILELPENKWDGKHRIGTLLTKYLGCENDIYTKEVERLIFHGGISRLCNPGCKFDYVPILQGGQGAGKSTFVHWLAIAENWFEEVNDIEGQRGMESVQGAWICEVSELLALTKNKEVEAAKSFFTKQSDGYRRPYALFKSNTPRACIFIGTTNKDQFLTDKTGNRRYLPVKVKNRTATEMYKKEEECRKDILQCWAEALVLYKEDKVSLVINPDLADFVRQRQEECLEDDYRVGVIGKYLAKQNQKGSRVCIKLLWDEGLGLRDKTMTKKDSNDIAEIMSQNFSDKWEKKGTLHVGEYGRQKCWERVEYDIEEMDENDTKNLPF